MSLPFEFTYLDVDCAIDVSKYFYIRFYIRNFQISRWGEIYGTNTQIYVNVQRIVSKNH